MFGDKTIKCVLFLIIEPVEDKERLSLKDIRVRVVLFLAKSAL
jgi:hypothetical protein